MEILIGKEIMKFLSIIVSYSPLIALKQGTKA